MSVHKIQIGQVWKQETTGDTFLVTKLYSEALSTVAILRKTGAETQSILRVKIERLPSGQHLPGFSSAQSEDGSF